MHHESCLPCQSFAAKNCHHFLNRLSPSHICFNFHLSLMCHLHPAFFKWSNVVFKRQDRHQCGNWSENHTTLMPLHVCYPWCRSMSCAVNSHWHFHSMLLLMLCCKNPISQQIDLLFSNQHITDLPSCQLWQIVSSANGNLWVIQLSFVAELLISSPFMVEARNTISGQLFINQIPVCITLRLTPDQVLI